jgi:hypothetical protein
MYPEETQVETRFPLTPEQEDGPRDDWPWLPGTVLEQVGPDEWLIGLDEIDAACFRDASEIRVSK